MSSASPAKRAKTGNAKDEFVAAFACVCTSFPANAERGAVVVFHLFLFFSLFVSSAACLEVCVIGRFLFPTAATSPGTVDSSGVVCGHAVVRLCGCAVVQAVDG